MRLNKSILKMSDAPRSVMNMIIRRNVRNMVEIGVYRQSFCRQILKTVGDHLEKYWLVDPWNLKLITDKSGSGMTQEQWDNEYANTCRLMTSHDCVRVLRMTSIDAAKMFEHHSLDLVYIDGSHNYDDVITDIRTWLPRIKNGGAISGHDYGNGWPEVVKAVDECLGRSNINIHKGTVWSATL